MQYKLSVGDTLDLNFQLGENEEDAGLTYSVSEAQQAIISVDAAGVVTALDHGTAVVYVTETANDAPIATVIVKVLTDEELEAVEMEARGLLDITIDGLEEEEEEEPPQVF
jgi:uncharacterized protein YjdB